MKHVVLLNSALLIRNDTYVMASQENGKWQFTTAISKTNNKDITASINSDLLKLFEDSSEHYLKPFTKNREFETYFEFSLNEVAGFLNIKTEIYRIHTELFKQYVTDSHFELLNVDTGKRINVTPFFLGDQERFLIQSIEEYSVLVNYIEYTRNSRVLNSTYRNMMGVAFFVDGQRWMDIVDLSIVGVENPISWLLNRPSLSKFNLIKSLNAVRSGDTPDTNYLEPQLFKCQEALGNISYSVSTPRDILQLLHINIPKKLDISSMFAVQLIGVCILKALNFEVKTKVLPSSVVQYYTTNEGGKIVNISWESDDLTGKIGEVNILAEYLNKEIGKELSGMYFEEFERMRL